ncbi:MAG: hypothetical protein HY910_09825 [Desulfarculus sp.]|nr:hypothetical protein [Desulfarculus sp.]
MPPRRAKNGLPPSARRLGDPRGAAQALRRLLGERVEAVLAAGSLDREQAEELAKIGALLEKLEQGGYDLKAAAVEVGARLVEFVAGREADPGKKAWLADVLDAFYFHLDQGPR